MPVAGRRAIPLSDVRVGVPLLGAVNGVNSTFTTPEPFLRLSLYGETISVLYNGQRLYEGALADYTLAESGGVGSGFDTVLLSFAPRIGDLLVADYVVA